MIDLQALATSVLVAILFGVFLGGIFKHAWKFLMILGVIVVVMIGAGYASTTFLTSLINIAQEEASAFQKDPFFFGAGDTVFFMIGLVVGFKIL